MARPASVEPPALARAPEPEPAAPGTAALRRNTRVAAPLILLVAVAYFLAVRLAGVPIAWGAVGLGALGWLVALMLRSPIALALKAALRTPERLRPWIVASSGPCEELARLGAVLLLGRAFPAALSLGLGWAAIEVIYSLVNQIALTSLMGRTDEKARKAKELLATQGMESLLTTPAAPFIGAYERIPASAIHIGFALVLAAQPLLVLLTIPLHSATNMLYLRAARRSPWLAEALVTVVGAVALIAGLHLFGRL